jgi:hypothetical protein
MLLGPLGKLEQDMHRLLETQSLLDSGKRIK